MIFDIDIDKAEKFFSDVHDCETCPIRLQCAGEMYIEDQPQPSRACALFILRSISKETK